MSTRSATIIRQTTYWGEEAESEELMRFYRHCDGYPDGHGIDMAEAIEAYQYDRQNNIDENGVLMVTITLNEYRQLVTAKAKSEQHKYDSENWQLRQEVERLKAQIVKLASEEDSEE